MRSVLLIFILSFTLQITAQNSSPSLGEFMYKVPLKKHISVRDVQTEWWNEYLEWPLFDNLFSDLLHKIDSGKIQVMDHEYPFTKILSPSEVKGILHTYDSSEVIDAGTGYPQIIVVATNFDIYDISSVTFCEEWSFDEKTLTLTKKVKGFLVNKPFINRMTGEEIGEQAMFYIPLDPIYKVNLTANKNPSDIRSVPVLTYNFKIDTLFRDLKTQESVPLNSLMEKLKEASEKNKKIITDPNFPYTSHPNKKQLKELIAQLPLSNNIKFYEEWDLDINKLSFEKKVKGIILSEKKYKNDTLSERKIMFIPLNGFVPNDPFALSKIQIEKISHNIQFANFKSLPSYINMNKLTNSDSAKMMSAAISIANAVKQHKIKAFNGFDDPWDPIYHQPLPDSVIDRTFTSYDTILTQSLTNGMIWDTTIEKRELDYKSICGFRFFESWNFDPNTLHFTKKIKAISCIFPAIDNNTGDVKFLESKINIDIPIFDPQVIVQDQNLIGKNITYSVPIDWDIKNASGEYMTDGSIGIDWNKSWQENLYQFEKYPLVQGIIDGVCSGKIKAVNTVDGKPLKPEEVKLKIESMKDSTFIKAGDLSTDYTLVNALKFSEDWYFDPKSYGFYKKVNSITFVHISRTYNSQTMGEDVKENPIFTLNLN